MARPTLLAVRLEKVVIEKVGGDKYWAALQDQFDWPRDGGTDYVDEMRVVTAHARTRALACLKAMGIEVTEQEK